MHSTIPPARKPMSGGYMPSKANLHRYAGMAALVVDDDEFLRKALTRQLALLGIGRVAEAGGGERACRALMAQGPFDLVTCDLSMPGLDGMKLLAELAAIQPSIGVLLVTGMPRESIEAAEQQARALRLNLLGSLRKPVQLRELDQLMQRSHVAPAAG
ncbi:MAG TPA: response regulator [Nevskiaceae bacterium]|nr:response regulator [Nevskiaceae bacterium]